MLLEYSFTLRDHAINNIHVTQHYITAKCKYVAIQQDCKRTKSPEISNVAKPILQILGCHLGTPNYSSMSTLRPPSG